MRFVVTIQHPAHVHFFRHVIDRLATAGHAVHVFAREKPLVKQLLEAFDIPHRVLAGRADSVLGMVAAVAEFEYRLLQEVRGLDPDVITAIGGLEAAHVARLAGTDSVVFTDTEVRTNRLSAPFATLVATPRRFGMDFGRNHVRYDGYHELAYLHADVFDPDPEVLRNRGIAPDDHFSVVRFSDMTAHHDVGEHGFDERDRHRLLTRLEDFGPVYVSREDDETGGRRTLPVRPHLVHHLLYYADVVVTDASTFAAEAGMLGTPTVRSNSFAGEGELSNFVELEEDYDLVRSIPHADEAIRTAARLAGDDSAPGRWRQRRDRLLEEKIEVTPFVIDLLESVANRTHGHSRFREIGTA